MISHQRRIDLGAKSIYEKCYAPVWSGRIDVNGDHHGAVKCTYEMLADLHKNMLRCQAAAALAVASLDDVEEDNGWIACSEKMPDEFKWVLVYSPARGHHTGYRDNHRKWYWGPSEAPISDDYITHWRRLPAPPEK